MRSDACHMARTRPARVRQRTGDGTGRPKGAGGAANSGILPGMLLATLIAATLAIVPLAAAADSGGKKIAVVVSFRDAAFEETLSGFQDQLGRNIREPAIEVLRLDGDPARASQAVQKLKSGGLALIVTFGPLATDAVTKEITTVPVVAGLVLNPGQYGRSGNVTGVGLEFPVEQQFDWIRRVLPDARTVGVLYNPAENRARIEAAQQAAKKRGLTLDAREVNSPRDVPGALDALSKSADVLWSIPDTLALSPELAKHLLLFSFRNGIPFIGLSTGWVKAGALYSLDVNYRDVGAQCAEMALKILNGERPEAVPPAAPRALAYSLNLTAARQLKIELPADIVQGARRSY